MTEDSKFIVAVKGLGIAAVPPDMRKVSDFPCELFPLPWAMPALVVSQTGVALNIGYAFRSGRARSHIGRHSRKTISEKFI